MGALPPWRQRGFRVAPPAIKLQPRLLKGTLGKGGVVRRNTDQPGTPVLPSRGAGLIRKVVTLHRGRGPPYVGLSGGSAGRCR